MAKLQIKKGDTVVVISGKDKGKAIQLLLSPVKIKVSKVQLSQLNLKKNAYLLKALTL